MMLNQQKVSLEQWRMLQAVVDCGSYASAAEQLQKSQSTLSHGLNKLQQQLGIAVLEIQGRRAVLTTAGETLLRRARRLLEDAKALENTAETLATGWETELTLVVDVICPQQILFKCLQAFESEHPEVRLDILETSLSGTQDAITQGQADVAMSGVPPTGFLGQHLCHTEMVCVAHSDHPLSQLAMVEENDLQGQRQIVVRDSGSYRRLDSGWLRAERRWTVNGFTQSLELLRQGMGFAWMPADRVQADLDSGLLKRLPLQQAASRHVNINLYYPKRERTGPAATYLGQLLIKLARASQISVNRP